MFPTESEEIREVNDVTILGPDLFGTDEDGQPLSPIASAFPGLGALVTGRGIHAMHSMALVEYIRKRVLALEQRGLSAEEEDSVYADAVSLIVRDSTILIRSDPAAMDRIFAADEMLQLLVPKERIQFTGIHLPEVRRQLRLRGESWRISPQPRSVREIEQYIRASRVQVSTGAVYYQNAHTGGRFLTYEEFMRIRPLIRGNGEEALARLQEIVALLRLVNEEGAPELSFFLPGGTTLSAGPLMDAVTAIQRAPSPDEAEKAFDLFARSFAEAAGPDLMQDGEGHNIWRTTMFCRLCNISENEVEEWVLGLSPEFHLNVRWLPGARIVGGEPVFEPSTKPRVRKLIEYYLRTWQGVLSINIGRIVASQSTRAKQAGRERDVYLAVLEMEDGTEDIRIIRMIKWDVIHRLKLGKHWDQAIWETYEYRDYILDRLRAMAELGIAIPAYTQIHFDEEIPGYGTIPVFFFERRYVSGLATDKIPPARYAQQGFIVRLARLLGSAAGASMTLGRACPQTRHVYFDDADEVVQFDSEGLPERLVIAETTGSFTDWFMPTTEMLPHCLWHLAKHIEKAHTQGVAKDDLRAAIDAFADALASELERMQEMLRAPSSNLRALFQDRSQEQGSVRCRWEGILGRLDATNPEEIRRLIYESPHLSVFREE